MKLAAALICTLAILSIPSPATAAGPFIDDDGSVHEADIEAIHAEGITNGCNPPENDRYCPEDEITRGQLAAFLARGFDLPDAGESGFVDIANSAFSADIDRLAAAGITAGCNPPANDRFCPEDPVSRGQMAAFLARAMGLEGRATGQFIDVSGSTFELSINAIAAQGITKGCNPPENDRFCPDEAVTRAQMASFLARALGLAVPGNASRSMDLDIRDGEFYINGTIDNQGGPAEGLLLNSRMVQAISDFSGQMAFDPDENTSQFIAQLDEYRRHGLDAVTINLQGGLSNRAWGENYHNSAWSSSGELDPAYAKRLGKVLDALAEREMVGIVGLFYFRQDQVLRGTSAVSNAVENAIDFLEPWRDGIIVEVVNESDHGLVDQASLRRPQTRELVSRLRSAGYHASYSMVPGRVPSRADLGLGTGFQAANVVFLHGNNRSPGEIAQMARDARQRFPGMPILFNEDGPTGTNSYSSAEYVAHLDAAVSAGVGWGYYDQEGFQTAPVDWSLDSPTKRAVMSRMAELSGG